LPLDKTLARDSQHRAAVDPARPDLRNRLRSCIDHSVFRRTGDQRGEEGEHAVSERRMKDELSKRATTQMFSA
jgi:hypothetical protein